FSSMAHSLAADAVRGWEHAREAVALYRDLGDQRALANLLATLPTISGSSEVWTLVEPDVEPEEVEQISEEALAICRSVGWPSGEAFVLMSTSNLYAAHGRYADALAAARTGLQIARDVGHRQWETACGWTLGNTLLDI